jgi:GTP cyclohydrolase I
MQDQNKLKRIAKNLIEEVGDNSTRIGLKETPRRMADMWREIFKGYDATQMPAVTLFPNGEDGITYNNIILDEGNFYSWCEHHMALFYGRYYFGYIPRRNIIGISKIARIIDYFSSRLQVQERLGNDIVDYLEKKLQPAGIILVLKAHHTCKEIRGIKKEGEMTTSIVRGVFETDASAKNEFFSLVNL